MEGLRPLHSATKLTADQRGDFDARTVVVQSGESVVETPTGRPQGRQHCLTAVTARSEIQSLIAHRCRLCGGLAREGQSMPLYWRHESGHPRSSAASRRYRSCRVPDVFGLYNCKVFCRERCGFGNFTTVKFLNLRIGISVVTHPSDSWALRFH